jgi:hypothetical protein
MTFSFKNIIQRIQKYVHPQKVQHFENMSPRPMELQLISNYWYSKWQKLHFFAQLASTPKPFLNAFKTSPPQWNFN